MLFDLVYGLYIYQTKQTTISQDPNIDSFLFYPAEFAEDVAGLDASALWFTIDIRVPANMNKLAHGEEQKTTLETS